MEQSNDWLSTLQQPFLDALRSLVGHVPQMLGALLLLIAGWLVARAMRRIARILLERTDHMLHRVLDGRLEQALTLSERTITIIASALFWVVMLLFITVAAEVSGLDIFSHWLGVLFAYLPMLLAGVLIIIAGFIFSLVVRDLTTAAASSAHLGQAMLLGRLAQLLIMTVVVVIGIAQIGIDVSLLIALITVLSGVFGAGLALAFALGARELVSNMLAVRYVHQHLREGDTVRIGASTGRVIEITSSHIVLEADGGREHIPAGVFLRRRITLLNEEGEGNGAR